MMRKLGKLWLWIVYAFLFLPIFVVIAYSFNAAKYTSAWKGFTLKWYSQLFGNAALIDAVVNTLSVAALAASLATLLGVLAAAPSGQSRATMNWFLMKLPMSILLAPPRISGI